MWSLLVYASAVAQLCNVMGGIVANHTLSMCCMMRGGFGFVRSEMRKNKCIDVNTGQKQVGANRTAHKKS